MQSSKTAPWSGLFCVLFLLNSQSVSAAEDDAESVRGTARALAVEGRAAFGAGEYERALGLFRNAYGLFPAPTISLYEARALVRLSRLVEAKGVYERTTAAALGDTQTPDQFARAVEEAKAELQGIERRIPKVALLVTGRPALASPLSVYLDGVLVAPSDLGNERSADPGQHEAVVRRLGLPDVSRAFVLSEGETTRVELRVDDTPPGGSRSSAAEPFRDAAVRPDTGVPARRVVAYGALGLGAAGLGTGIVTGLIAAGRHSDAERECPHQLCVNGEPGATALDDFRALRTVSTVGYVVGALGVGTGVTLFLVDWVGNKRASSVRPWIGVASAGVEGSL